MVFCGRCGLQLAPGSTRCPRCGALTEIDVIAEDPHMNDATIISPHRDQSPTMPAQQGYFYPAGTTPAQRLDDHPSYPGYSNTPVPPIDPVSYPGYGSPAAPTYPSSPVPGQYGNWNTPVPETPRRRNGGLFAIIAVVLALLVVGGIAFAIFAPSLLQHQKGGQATPTITQQQTPAATNAPTATATSTPTPSQQARSVLEHYYNDINNKDYQDAYNLWGTAYQQSQPYSAFAAGYSNTIHDSITILSLQEQSGGTVLASIIITADEQTSSGPIVSTYQGSYVIGIENGVWKFLSGNFKKVS